MLFTTRRIAALLSGALLVLSMLCSAALALPRYPDQQSSVTDAAAVLSKATVDDLNALSKTLSQENTIDLHVVTVDFLDGYTMADYANGLRRQWALDDDDLLLILCVGEDRYAFAGGEDVNDTLSSTVQRKLLSTWLDGPFMRQEYDAALAALMPALVTEVNKAYHESIEITGLFGVSSQPLPTQDWMTRLMQHTATEDDDGSLFHITDEHIETGFSLGKVLLTILLLLLIFGDRGPLRSRRAGCSGCGCGCLPLSRLMSVLRLWRLWRDD